jgi:hypothetical protein
MEVRMHVPATLLIAAAPISSGTVRRLGPVHRRSLQLLQSMHCVSTSYRLLPNLYVFTIYNHLPISFDDVDVAGF